MYIKSLIILSLFTVFALTPLFAEVTGLMVWDAGPLEAKIVMPVVDGKADQTTIKSYLEAINSSSEYNPSAQTKFERAIGTTSVLPAASSNGKLLNAFNPNRIGHMEMSDTSLRHATTELARAGTRPLVLPYGVDLILSKSEVGEFHELIAKKIPLLTLLGGADVHPSLYGESNTHSKNTNLRRDKVELNLIRSYISHKKGVLVGFCRGHQITAVALGMKIHQDIESESRFSRAPRHNASLESVNNHSVESVEHAIKVEKGSLLHKASGYRGTVQVNSRHHQVVVNPGEHTEVKITATEGDYKMVEAMEFKDGKGFTFQFHPEDMKNDLSRRILKEVVKRAQRIYKRSHPQNIRITRRGRKSRMSSARCHTIFR